MLQLHEWKAQAYSTYKQTHGQLLSTALPATVIAGAEA